MSKKWIKQVFGTVKPVIAMCHFDALPGDPRWDDKKGIGWVIERTRINLKALQEGGVDAVMFSNEFSLPYLLKVEPVTGMTMARIIGEVKDAITVPFGVNVLWDPQATIELAVATGASFVREIFSGVYASDFGLWNTNCGEVMRIKRRLGGENIKTLFNIVPEASVYLGQRSLADIAATTVFNHAPDALCVSGKMAGDQASVESVKIAVEAVPDTPVFANTGVNAGNVREELSVADGAIIGTAFKRNGDFFDLVDKEKVLRVMDAVRAFRK